MANGLVRILRCALHAAHRIAAHASRVTLSVCISVCGLHMLAPDIAEVRGLAVHPNMQGRGLGKQLVLACEAEARAIDLPTLFAWTYQQTFFERCGFTRIEKTNLHPKVWSECQRCAFFENCNEIAMRKDLAAASAA